MKKIVLMVVVLSSFSLFGQDTSFVHVKLCDSLLIGNIISYEDINECFQVLPSDTSYQIKSYTSSILYNDGLYVTNGNSSPYLNSNALKEYQSLKEKGIKKMYIELIKLKAPNGDIVKVKSFTLYIE